MIIAEIEEATLNRAVVEEEIITETAADKAMKRRNLMLKAVAAPARAQAVGVLSNAARNFIAGERQAFNLNEPRDSEETPLAALMRQISGNSFRPIE